MSIADPLLDRIVGDWVLRGTIARQSVRQSVVHDVKADWVLAHHYIRIHEVSRERNMDGRPEYEAMVFIARNEQGPGYSCVWLDVTGGLSSLSIGRASPTGNELPFVFRDEKGDLNLTNAFVYNPKDDSWEWRIDNVEKGVPKEFARLRLIRA